MTTKPKPEGQALAEAGKATTPAVSERETEKQLAKRAALQGALSMSIATAILRINAGEDEAEAREVAHACADQMMAEAFKDLRPTNQLERMLIEQMVMTHAQIIMANHRAAGDRMDPDRRAGALAVTSRLMADFRKTMLALREWRAPFRQFIVAEQVNQAAQQVITGPTKSENRSAAAGPTIEVGAQDA